MILSNSKQLIFIFTQNDFLGTSYIVSSNIKHQIFSSGFVKVGSDTYSLRKDRMGDECVDFYDNCFYKKDGGQLNHNHDVLKI